MSIKLMSQVWDDADVKGSDLLVLLCLADHANDDGICWPSMERLAKRARISERQVRYSISMLVETGWVERVERGTKGRSTLYRVTWRSVNAGSLNILPVNTERAFPLTTIEPPITTTDADAAIAAKPAQAKAPRSKRKQNPARTAEGANMTPAMRDVLVPVLCGHNNLSLLLPRDWAMLKQVAGVLIAADVAPARVQRWYDEAWCRKDNFFYTKRPPYPNEVLRGVEKTPELPKYTETLLVREDEEEL